MKLPEPVTVAIVFATGEEIPGYTVEQMMAWGKANAEAEREACAKLCEAGINNATDWDSSAWDQACIRQAAAIRARGTP